MEDRTASDSVLSQITTNLKFDPLSKKKKEQISCYEVFWLGELSHFTSFNLFRPLNKSFPSIAVFCHFLPLLTVHLCPFCDLLTPSLPLNFVHLLILPRSSLFHALFVLACISMMPVAYQVVVKFIVYINKGVSIR